MTRNIRENSCSLAILELVWFFGEIPRNLISLAIDQFSDSQKYKALTYLEKEEFIITKKEGSKSVKVTSVTEKGKAILESYNPYYRVKEPKLYNTVDAQLRRQEAEVMLMSIGVKVLPKDKPSLAVLASEKTDYIWTEGENSLLHLYNNSNIESESLLTSGVFYSSREIRALLKKDTGAEATNHSRFVGVVFFKNHFYIVFNARKRMMKWNGLVENQTLNSVKNITSTWNGYEQYNDKEKISAIVFANSSNMLTSLIMGYTHGHIKKLIAENDNHNKIKYPYLNGKSEPYSHYYFVITDKYGSQTLQYLKTCQTENDVQKLNLSLIDNNLDFYKDQNYTTLGNVWSDNGIGNKVLGTLIPDLKPIHRQREIGLSGEKNLIVIAPKTYCKAIARSLGEQVDYLLDENLQPIPCERYSNNGYLESETPTVIHRKTKEEKKVSVNIYTSSQLKEKLQNLSLRKNMSVSQVINEMINQYFERRQDT